MKTRIGMEIEDSQDVQWPVDKIRLAGSEDTVRREMAPGVVVVEKTVVPWLTAFPLAADGEHGAK